MTSPANELTNRIIHEIYSTGGFAWRAESTGVFDTKKAIFRTAPKKGVADVLAVYKGRFLAIEVKIGKDRQSPEQQGFQANVEHCGAAYFVAHDYDSFQQWWANERGKM